jgi:hypothetical protein
MPLKWNIYEALMFYRRLNPIAKGRGFIIGIYGSVLTEAKTYEDGCARDLDLFLAPFACRGSEADARSCIYAIENAFNTRAEAEHRGMHNTLSWVIRVNDKPVDLTFQLAGVAAPPTYLEPSAYRDSTGYGRGERR